MAVLSRSGRRSSCSGRAIGDIITPNHLLAFKVITAILTPLFLSQVVVLFRNPAMFVLAGLGGFLIPDRLVTDLRKKREKAIVRALPGAVDVLSLSVEAGLEFLLALQRQVERGSSGPLRDELTTVLNDIRLGKSRSEALKSFAARLEVPDMSSFVSVLVQADALGASIGRCSSSRPSGCVSSAFSAPSAKARGHHRRSSFRWCCSSSRQC